MNERERDRLFELLTDDALVGLTDEQRTELNDLKRRFPEWEDDSSVELAAAAVNLSDLTADKEEALPAHLRAKILENADDFFSRAGYAKRNSTSTSGAAIGGTIETPVRVKTEKSSFFGQWLGWAAAAAACVAVAIALWLTYSRPPVNEAKNPGGVQTPEPARTAEIGKTPELSATPETAAIPEPTKIPANNLANNSANDAGGGGETPKTPETARKPASKASGETAKKPETEKTPENFRTPNALKTPEIAVAPTRTPELSAEQRRAQLLASAPDVVQTNWTAKDDDKTMSGDVVWSSAQQTGYIRMRGMPALDPSRETYQLWIIDEASGGKTPISAGVFSVGQAGEIIVPINAQSRITKPKSFAISKEKAGGVAKPSRIVAVAKI